MTTRRWPVVVLTILLAALLALPGCGALGEPASTESLLVRYAANEHNDNVHTKAKVDLALSLVGYRVNIPIEADVDVVGTALHGTVRADLSKLEVDDYEAEVYAHEANGFITCYVGAKVKDSVKWTTFDLKTLGPLEALAATNLLAAAEFNRVALEADDSVRYELDVPTTSILDTALSILDAGDLPDEFDADALRDALAGDKVRSYFTKDCLIHSSETVAMGTYSGELTHSIPLSIKVDARAEFDKYGEVDVASLAVPDEVKSKATPTTLHEKDPFSVLAVLGNDNPLAQRIGA